MGEAMDRGWVDGRGSDQRLGSRWGAEAVSRQRGRHGPPADVLDFSSQALKKKHSLRKHEVSLLRQMGLKRLD